ncbi:MAG TPA: UvrD-helicase domain-containing protein [Chitinophaga sp.]|uniref:UvrD-helicase domain-containing protein n=1 Tax=Chitinophaga sp. TaxID=1869181 RepID=UPI002CF71636|nr:UvrD-helicase domain-containing protein [Chitinophaga sp.]HVI46719.1 UvrD-helicase domain-containing protein [Chitinophaga sp.]
MIEHKIYKHFEAATVALEGSNLIEASAGTGKTYSIAILVLRLVLEKHLSIKEILMVTFTKAAVAELQERIRLFIRNAYKVSFGLEIGDDNITTLVLDAIDRSHYLEVQQRLRDAVLLLDETAVLTIHGFCQQTLNEFAFETEQLFGAEMVPDITPIIENELNKSWRKNITTLHPELLQHIWSEDMKDDMLKIMREHLGGKKYLGFDENAGYDISEAQQTGWLETLVQLESAQQQAEEALHGYINIHANDLRKSCESNTYAKKGLLDKVASPPDFIKELIDKRDKGYVQKLFANVLEEIDIFNTICEKLHQYVQSVRHQLYCLIIQEVTTGTKAFKERSNMLGYDDLINNLHTALVKRDNPKLVDGLQQKYKAVFIDEFQDTDRLQYEIFHNAFSENTTLFYIGDPKQSIYAWRTADIFTYFRARNNVQHLFDMNHNFRSSENMIHAMNLFFKPTEDFNTFYFEGEENSIGYFNVESPENNSKGYLYKQGHKEVPITVLHYAKKADISAGVAAQVAQLLLDPSYRINDKAISPSDIGILVRTGNEGRDVKHQLAMLGIPAVTIDDAKILQTDEARMVLYLLEAMETPDRSSINRALLSPFTGFHVQEILRLDDETALTLFGKYRDLWQEDGAYTALMTFIADFGVRNMLLQGHSENGERIITNLFQLTELVHETQSRKNLSMRDVISWLKRGIDGMATEGDEYMQRVESDEEAVNIATIHKSKGLEYKIVLTPFLDFTENAQIRFVSFRDPETGDYAGTEKDRLTEQQLEAYRRQQEQENRRLIYVAITRAVYKCYIFRNTRVKKSSLTPFLDGIQVTMHGHDLVLLDGPLPETPEGKYIQHQQPSASGKHTPVHFALLEEHWRKMSYSMLAAKQEQPLRARPQQQPDAYDNFIFHTLRRGAKTGNLLHFIFENINFADDSNWEQWLEEAIRRFVPSQREQYLPMLRQLMQHVFHTLIDINGDHLKLASIGRHKRLTELEFDFPVPGFQSAQLNKLSDEHLTVNVKRFSEQELEGMMNGKIDLFFEHANRYYILDWKSNYLGSNQEDYSQTALAQAMNESNYHLQYLIYTVAVKKYLENRIPGFDYHTQFGGVIYCFVRGIRNNSNSGIFTTKPSFEKIQVLEKLLTRR